ncbi:MAG: NAD(P)(+) transhydrogenase (Re/Si-specific) subunit beta, partial [Pseudomonadota bacterium]
MSLAAFGYLISAVCFILALRGLSSPATSQQGNRIGIVGMAIAIVVTLFILPDPDWGSYLLIVIGLAIGGVIGAVIAQRIEMTAMPQLVAAFHSLVGMAAVFVAAAALYDPQAYGIANPDGSVKALSLIEMGLGTVIGAITFTGSIIAFAKLQALMRSAPILLPSRHVINIGIGAAILILLILFAVSGSSWAFWAMTLLAFAIGVLLIVPIGGADMPVVVSMLNSYSGWAAAGIGFTLNNPLLIITGALVGSSGAILSYIMCKGMNRSFVSVILGGFGETGAVAAEQEDRAVKPGSAEDAAFIMQNARSVIIVPGYGMAVAQAQHSVRELMDVLVKHGVDVKFAIHPVA